MNISEFHEAFKNIRSKLKWFERRPHYDYTSEKEDNKYYLTENQTEAMMEFSELLDKVEWQIPFSSYKELNYNKENKPLNQRVCGDLVSIRPCSESKTYIGYYLGQMALSISHTIEDDVVTASHSFYNPAIFVPELNKVVFGIESWWSKIESEEDLKEITDKTIENVWYVKAMKELSEKKNDSD